MSAQVHPISCSMFDRHGPTADPSRANVARRLAGGCILPASVCDKQQHQAQWQSHRLSVAVGGSSALGARRSQVGYISVDVCTYYIDEPRTALGLDSTFKIQSVFCQKRSIQTECSWYRDSHLLSPYITKKTNDSHILVQPNPARPRSAATQSISSSQWIQLSPRREALHKTSLHQHPYGTFHAKNHANPSQRNCPFSSVSPGQAAP
jgi:hypothetical protein